MAYDDPFNSPMFPLLLSSLSEPLRDDLEYNITCPLPDIGVKAPASVIEGVGRPTSAVQSAAETVVLTTVQQITKPLPTMPATTFKSVK